MENESYIVTRRALHGVAELLLAGPQYAATGRIRLRAVPGGFATAFAPDVSVIGSDLLASGRRVPISGRSVRELAAATGLVFADLGQVYRDVSGLDPDVPLAIDPASAERIAAGYALGDAALRAFAPAEEPTLWPEHFDLAVTVGEVNYGVTPGDAGIESPYMYVGPWSVPASDDFWNVPFGAARSLPSTVEEALAFFREGRDRLAGHRTFP